MVEVGLLLYTYIITASEVSIQHCYILQQIDKNLKT